MQNTHASVGFCSKHKIEEFLIKMIKYMYFLFNFSKTFIFMKLVKEDPEVIFHPLESLPTYVGIFFSENF